MSKNVINFDFGVQHHWRHVNIPNNKQRDATSCGIFTMMNAIAMMKNISCTRFNQVHVPACREMLYDALLSSDCAVIDDFVDNLS